MNDYVTYEAPVWLWIGACFALIAVGLIIGALAAYALRIAAALDRIDDYEEVAANKVEVERDMAEVRRRLSRLEHSPQSVRADRAPDTVHDSKPPTQVLRADGDTLPPGAWVTHVHT